MKLLHERKLARRCEVAIRLQLKMVEHFSSRHPPYPIRDLSGDESGVALSFPGL